MYRTICLILALAISGFTLYTAIFGLFTPVIQRSIHISLVMILAYLLFPLKRGPKWLRSFDYIAVILIAVTTVYLHYVYGQIMFRIGIVNHWDTVMGLIYMVLIWEICRRVVGLPLAIIAAIFLAYAKWGYLVPGFYGHEGYSLNKIVTVMFLTTDGLFGPALAAAATFVAVFIIFGAFLDQSGGSKIFMDFATALAGRRRGGPAKIAVVSSALTGSINGSAVANVSTTGVFTIPLMKQIGYKAKVAGAVEAVASTGGSILPPVMGAGAFVMSEMAGIPYSAIIIAATIPALLYFFSIYFVVDFEAAKNNLGQLSKDQLPDLIETLKKSFLFFIPLIVLIVCITFFKYSIVRCGIYAILAVVITSFFNSGGRLTFKKLIHILETAAKSMLLVSIACAAAGLIVGVVTLTGLGLKMAGTLIAIGQSSLILTLLLCMIGVIVIGMGIPPTPAYIIFSVISVPVLIDSGVPALAAHLFIFFYACYAPITPPVALASYTAASISGDNPMSTSWQAFAYTVPAFVVPFFFIYAPELMGQGPIGGIVIALITALLGVMAFAAGSVGWFVIKLKWIQRAIIAISGILLIIPEMITNVIGLVFLILLYFANTLVKKRHNESGLATYSDMK